MPELREEMYSSQQICIPPTYPYLLRQFAKAAIRTQPSDLLKWATTYFRCLSLNIPPPVKPRLEYPIPRDHHGITPGWLKALLAQMGGSQSVSFKVLWDRWVGACLQHPNLIQILVLGGFEDNLAVPWLRFVALCAAHLTDNLTQTMILICEVLTEEPEGGSGMVPLNVFLDLYEFLARIDASVPQTLRNYYFLDKFLELWQEKIAKDSGEKDQLEDVADERFSLVSSESTTRSEKETRKDDDTSVVSCPSVTSQDPDNYMKLLMKIRADGGEEFDQKSEPEKKVVEEPKRTSIESKDEEEEEEEAPKAEPTTPPTPKKFTDQLVEDEKISQFLPLQETASRDTNLTVEERKTPKLEDQYLQEDLARLKSLQEAMMGESDDELEKYKASILAEAGLTESQMAAPGHFETKVDEADSLVSESMKSDESTTSEAAEEVKKADVEEREYEDVYVEAVPGIGPKVPERLILAVGKYLKEVARGQHDMVMPRNIRHFDCPPLEVVDD